MDKKACFYTLIVITLTACGGGETPTSAYTDTDSGISQSSEAGSGGTSDTVIPVEAGQDASTPDVPDASTDSIDAGTDAETPIPDAGTDSSVPVPDAGTDSSVPVPDAGSDSSVPDAGADSSVPECVPDSKDCSGLTPRTCSSAGTWVNGSSCSYICSDGVCTGSCTPTDKRCSGLASQTCSSSGQWVTDITCPYICSGEGVCSGSCTPTTKQCSGDTPQTCSVSGSWVSSSECPYVCDSGNCTGVCEPGDHRCSGQNSQTCNASGQWTTDTTCPFVCSGEGNCTGECVPTSKDCQDDTPRTCNASGSWVSGSECIYVCQSGSCTGICEPGSHRCSGLNSQTCNSSGQWATDTTCPYVCSGEGVCSGVCVPTSKDCQGDIPRTCNSSGQWVSGSECQYVCISGTCSGVCEPGSTQCSGEQIQTCNSQGQWNSPTNCAAVPGAGSYCSAGSCTFDCSLDYDDCDGNPGNGCEANLDTDGTNCGYCGHSCCGGACEDGTCEVYTSGIYPNMSAPWPILGRYDVSETDIYWTTGTGLKKRPRNGGSTTTLIEEDTERVAIKALKTDGADIFWADGGYLPAGAGAGIFSMNPQGDVTHHANTSASSQLITTPTDIFFAAENKGTIRYAPRPNVGYGYDLVMNNNGSPVVNAYAEPFVTDGAYVYATRNIYSSNQRPIVRAPIHGTTETTFVDYSPTIPTAAYSFAHLAVDETNLYYVFYIGAEPATNGIWKKPFTGGDAIQLVSSTGPYSVATDGTNVYYADQFPNRVLKVSVDGGTPTTLHTGSSGFRDIKVIDQCVYFHGAAGAGIQAIAVNP